MKAPNFVGRESDLLEIEDQLLHVMTGQAQVLLIEGLAGMGKTRLVEQIETRANRHDIRVAVGRCDEDRVQPYAPFRALLTDFAEAAWLDDRGVSFLQVLSGRAAPAVDVSQSSETKLEKLLFIDVTRAVLTLAEREPLILVIEDLHWADTSTLGLFDYLAFELIEKRSVPVMLVGTYRPVAPRTAMAHLLERLAPERRVKSLALAGLDERETRDFLVALEMGRPTQQVVQLIHRVTQGVPFFIQEAVYDLRRSGHLEEQGGYVTARPSALASLDMPPTLTEAIDRHIQSLSAMDCRVLSLMALLGDDRLPDDVLALEMVSESAFSTAIEAGIEHGVLRREATVRFVHPLMQRAFASRLAADERQRLHLEIAQAMQERYADDMDSHLLHIASHLAEARGLIGAETALSWFRRAGEQAFAMWAWDKAAHFYELAWEATEYAAHFSRRDRAHLLYQLDLAHRRNQDVGSALARFEQAMQMYREVRDTHGLANSTISYTILSFMSGNNSKDGMANVKSLNDILESLGHTEPTLSGYVMVILAQAYLAARQTDFGYTFAKQAIDLGLLANSNHICASAHNVLGLAFIGELNVQGAMESWQESAKYARRTDDIRRYSLPLINLPLVLNLKGQLEMAITQASEGGEVARTIQDWSGYSKALSHLVSATVAKGDFRGAEKQARQALMISERAAYPWSALRALQALSCSLAWRGLWDEADEALNTIIEPSRLFKNPRRFDSLLVRAFKQLIRTYQSQPLEKNMISLAEELMEVVRQDTYSLAPLCAIIELGAATFNPKITEQPVRMLLVAMQRGVVLSSGWSFLLPRMLGLAATIRHDWAEAEAHFQDALKMGFTTGARPEFARTCHDYARMILRRQKEGEDYTYATRLIETSRTLFHELGMLPYAKAVSELREAIPGAVDFDKVDPLTTFSGGFVDSEIKSL